jgi:putative dimethyl sulfoxide reductase chaperone
MEIVLADIYAFLGLLMRYPQVEFFDDDLLDSLAELLQALDWQEHLASLRQWRQACTDPLEDVQVEYTRLFINAVNSTPVPPYASVYLDGDRSLQGRTTEKTLDFYRAHGFDLAVTGEPADHLQYELEFLAALTREGQTEAAEHFRQTLFLPWFNRFRERCANETRHPFIRATLQLIDFFTKEEQ